MIIKEIYFPVIEIRPGEYEHVLDSSGRPRQYTSINTLIQNLSYNEYDYIFKYSPTVRIRNIERRDK